MVKIMGNEVWRANEKIGWIEDNKHIRARDNKRIGYFEENFVRDEQGHKIAYINGDHLYSIGRNTSDAKMELSKINESIIGGVISEIGRCAVYILLGN